MFLKDWLLVFTMFKNSEMLQAQKSPNVLYEVDRHSKTIVNWSMGLILLKSVSNSWRVVFIQLTSGQPLK